MQEKDFNYKGHRNSYTELNEGYFWTITINKWQHLLKSDKNKIIIINSLQWLVEKELVKIYGFVIMPNHIHLMWEQLSMNGKEFPKNSFEKFTAKTLVEKMKVSRDTTLKNYAVAAIDRQHNIGNGTRWQAILVFYQRDGSAKIRLHACPTSDSGGHLNPMQPHWLLCSNPADYPFSSALFYEQDIDEFKLLTHFGEVF